MSEKVTIPGSIEWQNKEEVTVAKVLDEGEENGGLNTLTLESGRTFGGYQIAGAVKVRTQGLEAPSAEWVERTILQKKGESDFLQLAALAKRKINFGEASMTFSKKLVSNTIEVSHGLGVKPIFCAPIFESTSDEGIMTPRVWDRTSTSFKFAYRCDSERNASYTVPWVAIG